MARLLKLAGLTALVLLLAVAAMLVLLRDGVGEMMNEARSLRDQGRIEQAADLFGQVALVAPDAERTQESLFEMGFTYYVVGMPTADPGAKGVMRKMALDAFSRLIEHHPDSPYDTDARLYLGEIYISQGMYQEALAQYEVVVYRIEDLERRQEILLTMARCYERLGQIDLAVERAKEIINTGRQGRFFESAHLMMARFYFEAGFEDQQRMESCVAQLGELLASQISDSTRQQALLRLVECLIFLERFEEAEATLARVEVDISNRPLVEDLRDRIRRWSMEVN